jgi:hypothetical protein
VWQPADLPSVVGPTGGRMNYIFWLIGVIVVIVIVLGFLGLR